MKTHDFVKTAKKALISHSVSVQNYTEDDCQIAYHATTNSFMQTIRFVQIFFCTIGAISSALFVFVLLSSKSKHIHRNLRISLASLAVAALIACVQLNFIAFYQLIQTLTTDNPCDAMYEARKCALLRFPVVLSIYATLCGIIVLAIERTIATIKYKTYEIKRSGSVAMILITTQWIVCILVAITSVLLRSDPGYVHYCTAYVSHPRTAVFSLCLMSVLEIAMLIYFIVLLQMNQRRQVNEFVNKAMHTLSERYQLQENVKIMRILIPSITVHAVLGLLGLGSMLTFAIVHRSADDRLIVGFAPFSEVVLLVIPIYAIVFPFVAVFRNKQLRDATRKALPFLFNDQPEIVRSSMRHTRATIPSNKDRSWSKEESEILSTPPAAHMVIMSRPSRQLEKESDTHFDLLNEMWKK